MRFTLKKKRIIWQEAEGLIVPFIITAWTIILAVGFSAAVGMIFGFAPARKASRLNPIDALRHV